MDDSDIVEEIAVAAMLQAEVLMLGGSHGPMWTAEGEDETPAGIYVNASDFFDYATASAMPLPHDEIMNLYRAWKEDDWGVAKWLCKRRKMRPIAPIEKRMRDEGAWTDEMEALPARA